MKHFGWSNPTEFCSWGVLNQFYSGYAALGCVKSPPCSYNIKEENPHCSSHRSSMVCFRGFISFLVLSKAGRPMAHHITPKVNCLAILSRCRMAWMGSQLESERCDHSSGQPQVLSPSSLGLGPYPGYLPQLLLGHRRGTAPGEGFLGWVQQFEWMDG